MQQTGRYRPPPIPEGKRIRRRRAGDGRQPAGTQAKAAPGLALVEYPSNKLANVADLKPNEPLEVSAIPTRMRPAFC